MIGSAVVSLLAGVGCGLAALGQIACARSSDEVEASARLYRLSKAFLVVGVVLIVFAVVGGEA